MRLLILTLTLEVTNLNAHAWVEVYIDGLGWVLVDPTGGSISDNPEDDTEGDETEGDENDKPSLPDILGTIVLVPYEIRKVYTGQAVSCGNTQFWIKSGKDLLPEGYRIEVKIEGSRVSVGKSESRITKISIFDADGNNITSQYRLITEKGVIEVMPIKIVLYTASATKEYDGRKLSAEECYISLGKLLDGHVLEASGYTYLVNIGSVSNKVEIIEIRDKDGNDVTGCYDIQVIEGKLTVTG